MNKYLSCIFTLCVLLACNAAWPESSKSTLPLRIEVLSSGHTQQTSSLIFSLTNISENAIQMDDTTVPWGLRVSVLLVATTKRGKENLRPAGYAIEDPFIVKPIRIAPGETVSGTVLLSEHIDHSALRKNKEDLLVFWHFPAWAVGRKSLGEYGGWVNIPFKKESTE